MEEWRPIPGADGYEASNLGRIRSSIRTIIVAHAGGYERQVGGRVLKTWLAGDEYRYEYVALGRGVKGAVHVFVGLAFLGPKPSPNHETAHWDGDGLNNRVANLCWSLHGDNERDKARHGTSGRTGLRGTAHPRAKLSWDDVASIRQSAKGPFQLARDYGVHWSTIARVKSGEGWRV